MQESRRQAYIRRPRIKLPRLPSGSRNPPGWGRTNINVRAKGSPYTNKLQRPRPAGNAPEWWTGTEPEWCIYWGLEKNGLVAGNDFTYQARLPGVGAGYYSQVDFLILHYNIAIEVQGKYWHYGQKSRKIFTDIFRVSAFAGQGIKVIFIDEKDAYDDPEYYVSEALRGIDHSHVTNPGKV